MKKILWLWLVLMCLPSLVLAQGLPIKDGNAGTLADVETCGAFNCLKSDIASIGGTVPSVTNPLPVRDGNGTSFYSSDTIGANVYKKVSLIQDIEVSASNSSTANIGSGASFTGTSNTTLGVGSIQVVLFADQNCTIQVQQAQEDPGVNWNVIDSWTYTASSTGVEAARTIQAVASSVRVIVTNNGGGATTVFRLQTVVCPICDTLPRGLTQLGNLKDGVVEIGGTAVVNGGLAGTLGIGGANANNTAITQNPDLIGVETIAQGSQPTAATAGNVRRALGTTEGSIFTTPYSSNRFSCLVQAVTATTQCQAAPAAGLRAYVVSIAMDNQVATVQTLDIIFGTGANCVTAPTALTHKFQFGTNGTTTSPISINTTFPAPLVPTAANAICVRPSAATAFGATITGYIAP
jgi:hypothetical protein